MTALADARVDYPALTRAYLAAQLAGDRRAALRLVVDEGLGRGAGVVELLVEVIRAAQLEIGHLWQANRISIAQEHLATGISQLVMARLFELATPAARNGKQVVVACVEGEQHDLPARLVADYLDHAGFDVRYLGANVPTDELATLVGAQPPAVLALSATMSFHLAALREAVRRVRALRPALPIIGGGHAFEWSPGLAAELAIATAPATPAELIDSVRSLAGVS
jgi:methanogenic corrinoid protein MtbC1